MSTPNETDAISVMERAMAQLKESLKTERELRQQIRDYRGRIDAAICVLKWNGSTTTTDKSRVELDAERALRFVGLAPKAAEASWACPECGQWNPPDVINCPVEGCGTPKAAEASKEGM